MKDHSSARSPRPSRLDAAITIRVTEAEKELVAFFAKAEGLSVGRFLIGLMNAHGRESLRSLTERVTDKTPPEPSLQDSPPRNRDASQVLSELGRGLQIPFLQKKHGAPLLRAVEQTAAQAHTYPQVVAWMASHLFEAIAREVASGNVVRVPGFAAVGPWRIDSRGVCVPRFQASQAFCDYLLTDGCREGANRQLQAHRHSPVCSANG